MTPLMASVRGGRRLVLPLVAALALLITGCGASGVSANRPAATAPPSPTPAPKVLYQADWTGSGVSQWKLAPGWQITSTGLNNTGAVGGASVYIPYTPTTSAYTVEIVMQLEAVVGKSACSNSFGLEGQTETSAPVYFATVTCMDQQWHGFANIYSATDSSQFHTYDYTPGRSSRTYTVNVDGPYVTYLLNGAQLGTVKCDLPTAPSRLLLLNSGLQTEYQRITITTP